MSATQAHRCHLNRYRSRCTAYAGKGERRPSCSLRPGTGRDCIVERRHQTCPSLQVNLSLSRARARDWSSQELLICIVCPASACVGAKVEAGSCPAAFARLWSIGKFHAPCWRNRRTCRWTLALEEEREMRDTQAAPNEQKRKEAGQKVRKGWIEKTGRK